MTHHVFSLSPTRIGTQSLTLPFRAQGTEKRGPLKPSAAQHGYETEQQDPPRMSIGRAVSLGVALRYMAARSAFTP